MDIAHLIQSYGYLAVAVGTVVEGESVLLAGAAAAFHGYLSLPVVITIAAVCGFLGDQTFFYLGRRYGTRLLARFPSLEPQAARASALLERHDVLLILGVRFMYGLRTAGPVAIGMSGVHSARFLILNLVGAVIWAMLIGGIGYGLGQGATALLGHIDADERWLLAALLAPVAAWWFVIHGRRLIQAWHR